MQSRRRYKKWTSNEKEIEAIFLGLHHYEQILKDQQINAGISNRTIDALSRLCTSEDYYVKKETFQTLCQERQVTLTLDLFAKKENILVNWLMAINGRVQRPKMDKRIHNALVE
ncbi:MAG: hypothetical protein EZS28_014489 [Streblomastix strix]|uniref:Reverse transcriptase RNase H-like domain-containing protein n=1 Tax=Streblomastix strix TaxID=222440 RepID=A0A5J4W5N8_9EUKA|nr:MAG: hypothetical protein EZS28_014489 [Streblomastix strix]